MERGGAGPARGWRRWAIVGVLAVAGSSGPVEGARAANLVGAAYTASWDQSVTTTDAGTTETHGFKHELNVSYKGFLKPVVQNEITLKVEQTIRPDDDPPRVTKIFPTITLSYQGSYWKGGAKRTIDDSTEPGRKAKTTDAYFVEFLQLPAKPTLPDLKGKYSLDSDFEAGMTDKVKHSVNFSSAYRPNRWLDLRGDYNWNFNDDNVTPDTDTRDETVGGTIGIRHFFSKKIRFNTEYRVQETRTETVLDNGGTANPATTQSHTWKNVLAFLPFPDMSINASYDFDLKQDLYSGEHVYARTYKAAIAHRISIVNLKAGFTRAIVEDRHTKADKRKTEDEWTFEASAKLLVDWSLRYQKKDTVEVFFDNAATVVRSGSKSMGGGLGGSIRLAPFWQVSAVYDKTDNYDRGVRITVDTKYSFKSLLDFKAVNLTIEPTYDIAHKQDLQVTPAKETETRDLKLKVAWKAIATQNMIGTVEHTYGRKVDTDVGNIQRTDDSSAKLIWRAPFPRWNVGIDVTRSATDTSEDELPPDVTSSFGFKADYGFANLSLGANYKYDMRRLTDDAETFGANVGWAAPKWSTSLSYSFNKTFSPTLNEGYSVTVAFKYNL